MNWLAHNGQARERWKSEAPDLPYSSLEGAASFEPVLAGIIQKCAFEPVTRCDWDHPS
jgi:hypothetical protein